jgi:ribosomal protein S18 acetylase RimI-like enzyme
VLEVRVALPSEYAEVGDLVADTYVADGYVGDDYAAILRDVAGRAPTTTVLAALLDGRIVGSATLAVAGSPYAEDVPEGTAVIRMVATDKAARGQGVGTALVEACLTVAQEAGCTVVRLSTQPTMAAAQRMYERLGFTRTPERDWDPVPGLTLLTYVLPLTYCGQCGERGTHPACLRRAELDPPRYCTQCRRRMVVQVHPTGWSARCVEHGTLSS